MDTRFIVYKRNASLALALVSVIFFAFPRYAECQQDQTESNRKVVVKVDPEYPHLARTMNLSGVVKLEAVSWWKLNFRGHREWCETSR